MRLSEILKQRTRKIYEQKADEYIKKKLFTLSGRLGKGQIKQVRTSNSVLHTLLENKGNVKQ